VFNSTFSTNGLYRATEVRNISGRAGHKTNTPHTIKQHTKLKIINTLWPGLCGDNLLTA